MRPFIERTRWRLGAVICCALFVFLPAMPLGAAGIDITDALYAGHHPRLLFSTAEHENLLWKILDGGDDRTAYQFILGQVYQVYPYQQLDDILGDDFAMEELANIGLVKFVDQPTDLTAHTLGRNITQYIADNWDVDFDPFGSALRLRTLCLGYDMFYGDATIAERNALRDEIESYTTLMVNNGGYRVWGFQPYLSNKSMMIASSLGLAAIVLDGEGDQPLLDAALVTADNFINTWLTQHVDPEGAYVEGALYAVWSLRALIYYFHARERFDGTDYSTNDKIRNMEKWFAFELDPSGGGQVRNIQDCTSVDLPLPRYSTYFEWAQAKWSSPLSRYIWDHVAGSHGYDHGDEADKVATVLWNQAIFYDNPAMELGNSQVWQQRGLYYYRSGWPDGDTSDDVVFSFYSGEYQGGHAQEDQNQFTLIGYGDRFAIDHGPGSPAIQSEAHSIVLVDGKGQHNAGNSIGTDGRIAAYVTGDFADFVEGEAAAAYSTYSPLNNAGTPFPSSDWSWGYQGANPMDKAVRSVIVVHDDSHAPYFLIVDDIEKDGATHTYDWRIHTAVNNTIDFTSVPYRVVGQSASLDIYPVYPPVSQLNVSISGFDNATTEPNSNVLTLSTSAVNPEFSMLLFPYDETVSRPSVTTFSQRFGLVTVVVWQDGRRELLIQNDTGDAVTTRFNDLVPFTETEPAGTEFFSTDARIAVLQFEQGQIDQFMLVDATRLALGTRTLLTVDDAPVTVSRAEGRIDFDRADARFTIYAPATTEVFSREERIWVTSLDGYLTSALVTGIDGTVPTTAPGLRAYPNPFNPSTRITITAQVPQATEVVIYDAAGRLVRRLWNGVTVAGTTTLEWDGRNDAGATVATGVYMLQATSPAGATTLKVTLIR